MIIGGIAEVVDGVEGLNRYFGIFKRRSGVFLPCEILRIDPSISKDFGEREKLQSNKNIKIKM